MQAVQQANEYLRGKRQVAVAVQALALAAEWLLWGLVWLIPAAPAALLCLAWVLDLLLLSPLRAGRALFFETLIADREAAQLFLVFRYYRHGYGKAVGWRRFVWGRRLLYNSLLQLPALGLLAIGRALADSTVPSDVSWSTACTLLGWLLAIVAAIGTELLLIQWQALPYLLSYRGTLCEVISLTRRATHRRTAVLVRLALRHGGGVLAEVLSLPLPHAGALYRTAQAATVRQLVTQIPKENVTHVLQRRKNCGKMDR